MTDEIKQILDSKLALEAYKDLGSSPLKESSQFITDVIKTLRLTLGLPFQFGAACQDRLVEFLNKTIRKVPKENRIKPANPILYPILQQVLHMDDTDYLRQLFSNLLAKAINRERVSEAHPGFVYTLSQLSLDEAIIMSELAIKDISRTYTWDLVGKKAENRKLIKTDFPTGKLVFASNFEMYLSHLYSLNLLYSTSEDKPTWQDPETRKIQLGGTQIIQTFLSDYGNLFSKACIKG